MFLPPTPPTRVMSPRQPLLERTPESRCRHSVPTLKVSLPPAAICLLGSCASRTTRRLQGWAGSNEAAQTVLQCAEQRTPTGSSTQATADVRSTSSAPLRIWTKHRRPAVLQAHLLDVLEEQRCPYQACEPRIQQKSMSLQSRLSAGVNVNTPRAT